MKDLDMLLEAARRASDVGMTEEDSAIVWERVRRGRPGGAQQARFAAIAAALLAAAAGILSMRRAAPVAIIKEIRFESVHEGKAVRFEMTVYREETEEKRDVPTPHF
jgi:hypothetical protein